MKPPIPENNDDVRDLVIDKKISQFVENCETNSLTFLKTVTKGTFKNLKDRNDVNNIATKAMLTGIHIAATETSRPE